MRWTFLIPLKALPAAKSRLRAPGRADTDHHRLVLALAQDTVRAASRAGRVVVVTDSLTARELIGWPAVVVTDDSGQGLNAALLMAARYARTHWPHDAIAAMLGDLPALTATVLADALDQAQRVPRAYVADASGRGTTLLTALPGVELDPRFGNGSARAHAGSGAAPITGDDRLRRDVDTADELRDAVALGVGPATLAALGTAGPAASAGWV